MRIYLTEGYTGEPVRVTVDGRLVLDLPDVRTNWSVGLAASTAADVQGLVSVLVELPQRRLRAERPTQAREDRALLVKVGEAGLEMEEVAEPVRFV